MVQEVREFILKHEISGEHLVLNSVMWKLTMILGALHADIKVHNNLKLIIN